ncbi:phosphatidate cytidylyltransferase [Candidatus Pelagibacter sp. HIMB1593]|uniref:phosphatidate cytidylyltransferase n=1 Tax=Candidatus Pelagibacter sp. HIMB1593 TaxID=3413355 RepID=UPI003F84B35E
MKNELILRILSSILLLPICLYLIINGSLIFNVLLIIIFIIASYEWHLMSKNKRYYYYGFIFLIFSLITVFKLRIDFQNDYWPLLVASLICIFTDIGGYLFGKVLKGPKLTIYSPNKTYSGLLGSFIISFFCIPIFFYFNILNEEKILNFVLFIFIISSTSQFGDILISYFKRISNIKDSGKVIPGHGGILDRIDGMLFALPVAYYLFLLDFFNVLK